MNAQNKVLEAIRSRRSVRSFDEKPVDRHLIDKVIEAGNWAATAGNLQPWRFVVVQDEGLKEILRKDAKQALVERMAAVDDQNPIVPFFVGPYARSRGWQVGDMDEFRAKVEESSDPVFYNAPVIICIIGTGGRMDWDCPAVCQNMLLAAHSLGLGSIWIMSGVPALEHPQAKEAIELAEGEKAFGMILLGYPCIWPDPPPKKLPSVKWL